jgi:Domain of unknown function (DUF4348)
MISKNQKYLLLFFLIVSICSCRNTDKVKSETISINENFSEFIEKFSKDSLFQISRIKFPLKITWQRIQEDLEMEKDSIFFMKKATFELIDFRKKKSNTQLDNWEQKRNIYEKHNSATILYQGVDNGIIVEYLFKRENEKWILTEIFDRST